MRQRVAEMLTHLAVVVDAIRDELGVYETAELESIALDDINADPEIPTASTFLYALVEHELMERHAGKAARRVHVITNENGGPF